MNLRDCVVTDQDHPQGFRHAYLAVRPERQVPIAEIELIKGPDRTAPIIMAATIESP